MAIKTTKPIEAEAEIDYLRRRNAELEKELSERREREEEEEERLCVQLGELEEEAIEEVHMYRHHIKALSEQLELAKKVLVRSGLTAINGASLVLDD
ncbi:UP-9A [Rhynchospora pubera]|uniref:UP-9A n=1 Tax=Rhynchospora pubera TaxID=906938 RepID=A0AAV8F009_9POAL|nr:UP-9A [Rhynchospora pubera]